jgi:uncharacterized membrane protein YfhO
VDWRASVDGRPATVLRGDHALLVVRVPAGARRVELDYHSKTFARGKAIGLVALLLVLGAFVIPPVMARRRRG